MAIQTKSALELGQHASGLWGEVKPMDTHAEQELQHVGAIICQAVLFAYKRRHKLPSPDMQSLGLH